MANKWINDINVNDFKLLRENFYENYDRSLMDHLINEYNSRFNIFRHNYKLLGEGVHFQAWKISSGHFPLVMSISQTWDDQDPSTMVLFKNWFENIKKLAKISIPLIPPFELLQSQQRLAIVLPLGDLNLQKVAPHWQPLVQFQRALENDLYYHGLKLTDGLQMAQKNGVPFVFDLSDLELI